MDKALVMFAKAPIPGEVKTRLCPPLTPDEAASLHGSFILDALERTSHLAKPRRGKGRSGPAGIDRFVACTPSPQHAFFKVLEQRHGVKLIEQVGDDLGARMEQAFAALFRKGYQRVILIGTDLPTLSEELCQQAFALLDAHDLVLGPALDGGYYLIGLKQQAPELFKGIPWSTPEVLNLTQEKATALGLKIGLLPSQRDVDTLDDLRALIAVAASSPRTVSKRTEGVLRLLASRHQEELAIS